MSQIFRKRENRRAYEFLSPGFIFKMSKECPRFSPRVADKSFNELLRHSSKEANHTVLDPFCGNGSTLCTLAILHRGAVSRLIACDIEEDRVKRTLNNLKLCSINGWREYLSILEEMRSEGKTLDKAKERLLKIDPEFEAFLREYGCDSDLEVNGFQADLLTEGSLDQIDEESVDLVLTDPPHGKDCHWNGGDGEVSPETALDLTMKNIRPKLRDGSIVGLSYDRRGHEDVLLQCTGYELLNTQTTSSYRSRVLYTLRAVA